MSLLAAQREFTSYGPSHLAVLALFVLGAAGLVLLGRAQRGTTAERVTGRAYAAVMVTVLVPIQIISVLPGRFDPASSLPLHLSDLAWPAAAYALWSHSAWAYALTYYWGLTLTSQALVTPALGGPDFPSLSFTSFWSVHLLTIWAPIYLTWGVGMRPTWWSWRTAVVVTLGWMSTMLVFNAVAGTNYGFLNAKPETASLLDYFGPWPWYLLTELVIVSGAWALMTWPWVRADRRARSAV